MNKAEMEAHAGAYQALLAEGRLAEKAGQFGAAIKYALASFEHIDGMMQYERKYQDRQFAGVAAIDLVLRYAPLLFDHGSLEAIEALLKETRRIERDTSEDMGENLARARETMWNAHRLWNHLEGNPGARQDDLRKAIGGDQDHWRAIAEAWARMKVINRAPVEGNYRLTLWTRIEEPVKGKCPSCGNVTTRPKTAFLSPLKCPSCLAQVGFVLQPATSSSTRE